MARRSGGFRWVVDAALPIALTFVVAALAFLAEGLETEARWALFACAEATVLWSTTRFEPAHVALTMALFLVLVGAVEPDRLHDSLATDVVWLMIGAFVVAGALRATGVATRATRFVLGRARTVGSAVWWMTAATVPLALFVPSTSARAAMVLPLFHDVADAVKDRRVRRAFALLLPSVILVSTIGSLVAAGSHLIAVQLLAESTGRTIDYLSWLLWGGPYALLLSAMTAWVIARSFLPKELRARRLELPPAPDGPIGAKGIRAIVVVLSMIILWVTHAIHGIDIATATIAGALLLTMPGVGVMRWNEGLKTVSWNLVLFVGAALVLGKALIESGAGNWVLERVIPSSGGVGPPIVFVLVLTVITVTAHIYMPSHAARAAAFVPPLVYLGQTADLDTVAIVFIANVGLDYCLTLPISSKALLLYQQLDRETFEPSDLLRLSAIMLPLHVVMTVLFYFFYWRPLGLTL